MIRWFRSLFAWRTVFIAGLYLYQENEVTGARRAREGHLWAGGYTPLDSQWLAGGERAKLPPPPKQKTNPKPDVKFLGDVQRLQLKAGDILVLRSHLRINPEVTQQLVHHLKKTLGEDQKVMVLVEGLEVGILSPEPA